MDPGFRELGVQSEVRFAVEALVSLPPAEEAQAEESLMASICKTERHHLKKISHLTVALHFKDKKVLKFLSLWISNIK